MEVRLDLVVVQVVQVGIGFVEQGQDGVGVAEVGRGFFQSGKQVFEKRIHRDTSKNVLGHVTSAAPALQVAGIHEKFIEELDTFDMKP